VSLDGRQLLGVPVHVVGQSVGREGASGSPRAVPPQGGALQPGSERHGATCVNDSATETHSERGQVGDDDDAPLG
jgi:hypothetical protein